VNEPSLLEPGTLGDDVIELIAGDASPLRRAYAFDIRRRVDRASVGRVILRLDPDDVGLVAFAGHLAYEIDPEHRGQGLAARACRLLVPLARRAGFRELWIMTSPENAASIRTLHRLGAEYVNTVEIPSESDMRALGITQVRRHRWTL
jgi:tagatose 1,6-diphosphate aldolase